MSRHLLDLSTIEPDRQTIRIDGTVYELALPGDFGLAGQARILRLQKLTVGLTDVADLTDEETERAVGAIDVLVSMVVRGIEPEVIGRLKDGQKIAIIQAFIPAAATTTPEEAQARRPRPRSTGARSLPGSTDSTAPAIG